MFNDIIVKVIINTSSRSRFFYGWVIVVTGMVLMASNSTIINSFGVFFKPLAADFGWSRAATSTVQSIILLSIGIFAICMGWLADRFGRSKVMLTCGILTGSGLFLTSQVNALWQIYLTYGLMTGIGLSSTFAVTGTATARWFRERRGLALGITTSGYGLGFFVGVPMVARLIENIGWSRAYLTLSIAAFLIMVTSAYFLKRNHETGYSLDARQAELKPHPEEKSEHVLPEASFTLMTSLRDRTLWILFGVIFLFSFSNFMISVHLVNHATDVGIAPLIAATIVSGVGLASAFGRLLMGIASDKIGNINALIIACLAAASGLILLVVARELWVFYVFALVYGFAWGAEVPQQTALIVRFFGLQTVLVAIVHCASAVGGALGSWAGGKLFDVTQSYEIAFFIAIAAMITALFGSYSLRKRLCQSILKLKTGGLTR